MTVSGVHVRTSVHVTARSYTYLVNEINRAFLEIITGAGLDPGDYTGNQAVIEKGLRTWVTLRQLETAHLEIFEPETGQLRTRVDLGIEYRDSGEETYETDIGRIRDSVQARHPGCLYRIVVTTSPGAAEVQGWSNTELLDVSHLGRQNIGEVINTGAVGARMYTWR
jgi:Bacterial HORMA domain 2